MRGADVSLCLLLWTAATAFSSTRGEVLAPAHLSAEVGRPLLLACNITRTEGDTVRQVRWLDKHRRLLLAYEPGTPLSISYQDPSVQVGPAHNSATYSSTHSSVTIRRLGADNEGCYRCVFDVFPSGRHEGKTCVSVTGKVRQEGNKTAVSGKPATLSCWFSLPVKVYQVLWRKTAEQGDTAAVASHAKGGHHSVKEPFAGRVELSRSLGDTQLSIGAVRTEDEGCYTCEFHTYPDGTNSATSCLSVYVLPKPEVSHVTSSPGVTEANCTATARPAPEVTWDVGGGGGDNRTLGPPVLSTYDQGDGTTVVTSTLVLQGALHSEPPVRCVVHHPGLEKPLTVTMNTDGPAMVVLLSVCGVAAVLLLCLCVCLCRCFVCTDD